MSGGALDYADFRIQEVAERIEAGGEYNHAVTDVHRAFVAHLRCCAEVVHAIEEAWSGDTSDADAEAALERFFAEISHPHEGGGAMPARYVVRDYVGEDLPWRVVDTGRSGRKSPRAIATCWDRAAAEHIAEALNRARSEVPG